MFCNAPTLRSGYPNEQLLSISVKDELFQKCQENKTAREIGFDVNIVIVLLISGKIFGGVTI